MTLTTLIPFHAHHDSVGRGLRGACVHGGGAHSSERLREHDTQTPFGMRTSRSYSYAVNFTFTFLRPVTPWDVRLGRCSAVMGCSSFISYARRACSLAAPSLLRTQVLITVIGIVKATLGGVTGWGRSVCPALPLSAATDRNAGGQGRHWQPAGA